VKLNIENMQRQKGSSGNQGGSLPLTYIDSRRQ